eukprot:19049-Heterococcus_DN1.PRE.4
MSVQSKRSIAEANQIYLQYPRCVEPCNEHITSAHVLVISDTATVVHCTSQLSQHLRLQTGNAPDKAQPRRHPRTEPAAQR